MEGKWFADSLEGALKHAKAHYADDYCYIVAAEVPDDMLVRLYRLLNLDGFGPATFLDMNDLNGVAPVFKVLYD